MRLLAIALIVIPLAVNAIGFLGLGGGTFTVTYLVEGGIGQFEVMPKYLIDGIMAGGGLVLLLVTSAASGPKEQQVVATPTAVVEASQGPWRCRCGQTNDEGVAECPNCKRTAAAVI